MRNVWVIAILVLALTSCGNNKDEQKKVELKTFKDKISYIVGATQAQMITRSGDPNLEKLSFDDMALGFNDGMNDEPGLSKDCENSLSKLYGPYGQDFDTTQVKAGSRCIGRLAGSVFYKKWNGKKAMDQFDMDIVNIGFKDGLYRRDTLIKADVSNKMYFDFLSDINKKFGNEMMAEAATLENTKTVEGGIVIETLEEGSGASPSKTDDVKVNYVVVKAEGDTLENSFQIMEETGQPIPAFNLTGVIQGWGIAFPNFKKGGKYNVYIPWELAYGERDQCESLMFYIELLDFGPKGSLVEAPKMQPQQMQGMPPQ